MKAKRLQNIEEHGVDFRYTALIFENGVLEAEDDYGERRLRALGHVDDDFYLVVYTWRDIRRRIISAGKVGADGQKRYRAILGE